MIRLFPSNTTEFTTNGLGYLPDATECVVTEERNGAFELEMKYPVSGKRYSDILLRSIIVAKPNPYDDPQPFRIYEISRPMKGSITIKAEHISYDINGIPVTAGWQASSPSAAFEGLKSHAAVNCPFTFWTDKTTSGTFKVDVPVNMRSCLGGVEGSILDIYRGEYKFDRYMIRLYGSRGMNRGVSIRYGKNLTDLQQDENCANVYTGVYGYWYSDAEDGGGLVETSPKVINVSGSFNYQRVLLVDFSSEFQDKPTAAQLKDRVNNYISNNDIGIPKVNLDVSFVNLMDSEEYKELALLETVHLCDTVNVIFEELGVNATAKVITTRFNCLTNKYDSIELGDAKSNLANTIANQKDPDFSSEYNKLLKEAKKAIEDNNSILAVAIAQATKLITGNLGGHVVLHSSTGGDTPDEILIMDTTNISTAKKIWRWNLSGLGYSSTGYNGPYGIAATMNGAINADFIVTGTLSANLIKSGTLSANFIKGGELTIGERNDGLTMTDKALLFCNDGSEWGKVSIEAYSGRKPPGITMTTQYGTVYFMINSSLRGSPNLWYSVIEILSAQSYFDQFPNSENFYPIRIGVNGVNTYILSKCRIGGLLTVDSAIDASGNITGRRFYSTDPYTVSSGSQAVFSGDNIAKLSSSSKRYKDIVAKVKSKDVEHLYNIQPVIAKYKDGYLKTTDERNEISYIMFIAEDVEKYFPEAVDHDLDGNPETWNAQVMIPAMFQMIKSQKEEIELLKEEISRIKGEFLNEKVI